MTPLRRNQQVTNTFDEKNTSIDNYNGAIVSPQKQSQMEKHERIYKLIIQIDKIKARPGPKSKKSQLLKMSKIQAIAKINENIKFNLQNDIELNDDDDDDSPTNYLQCELNSSLTDNDQHQQQQQQQQEICIFCKNYFTTKEQLVDHIKMIHFYCNICGSSCDSKESYDEHEKLHDNKDPLLLFKCHICSLTFDCHEAVQLHNEKCHINGLSSDDKNSTTTLADTKQVQITNNILPIRAYIRYQCKVCKAILKDDTPCRDHFIPYPTTKDFTFSIPVGGWKNKKSRGSLQVNNKLMARLNDHQMSFKMCKLCNQYIKLGEMEKHIAQHISQAYPCLMCRKLFISNESLQNHVKTHLKIDPQ